VGEASDGATDLAAMSAYLRALAEPNRLELLRKLQVPRALEEIELHPTRRDRARRPDRPLSRQGVERHVRALQGMGLVQARRAERDGREVQEYVVNHARLFVVVDELRRLSLLRALGAAAADTVARDEVLELAPALPPGPALVLVWGANEGAVYPLRGAGPWPVGREKGLAVSLPHDPFTSKRNAVLRRAASGFAVESLPSTRNGTRVNWVPVPEGQRVPIAPGDTLGVGRSLLLFRGSGP
jgi:DNA-binding transcriptional ArsR family regulator